MKKPSGFTFYRENRKDQVFKITREELKEKYLAFLKTKENEWILYYGDQTVYAFVADKDGLNSTGKVDDSILDLLQEVRHGLPCYSQKAESK